jgi:hypothetical protein
VSPIECGVSECESEALRVRRPWPTRRCCAMEEKKLKRLRLLHISIPIEKIIKEYAEKRSFIKYFYKLLMCGTVQIVLQNCAVSRRMLRAEHMYIREYGCVITCISGQLVASDTACAFIGT